MTDYIKNYYSDYDEEGRLERRHQKIEFLTTTKYVCDYLKPGMRICEIGAATGKYSRYFADLEYRVDSVELVKHNIDIFKSKITDHQDITIHEGNALNLNMFEDELFDMTLVLGPMYHMYTEEDKKQVVSEALRITKQGGYICFAYITHDAVILEWGLQGGNFLKGLKDGLFTEDYKCISEPHQLFSMFHVDEFDELVEPFPITHLHTIATDGVAPLFRDIFNSMDGETYAEWVRYHFKTCERRDLLGYSSHILYMGQKK